MIDKNKHKFVTTVNSRDNEGVIDSWKHTPIYFGTTEPPHDQKAIYPEKKSFFDFERYSP